MTRILLSLAALGGFGLMAPHDRASGGGAGGRHIGGGYVVGAGGIVMPAGTAGAAAGSYGQVSGPVPEQYASDQSAYLTEVAIDRLINTEDFLAPQVFPLLPVPGQSGQIKTWDRGSLLRDEMRLHKHGDRPVEGDYEEAEPVAYHCEHWSLSQPITVADRASARDPLRPERDALAVLTKRAATNTDRRFMKFFHPSQWGWNYKGVSADPSTAVDSPEFLQLDQSGARGAIATIAGKIRRMREATGEEPNTLVMGTDVFDFLRLEDPDVIDRIKYTQRGIATADLLAQMLGIPKLVVAKTVSNEAKQGQKANIKQIFPSRGMLLLHATANPSLETPTAGYMTVWERLYEQFQGDQTRVLNELALIRKGYNDESGVRWLQIHTALGLTVIAPDLGMFFEDVVSTEYR